MSAILVNTVRVCEAIAADGAAGERGIFSPEAGANTAR